MLDLTKVFLSFVGILNVNLCMQSYYQFESNGISVERLKHFAVHTVSSYELLCIMLYAEVMLLCYKFVVNTLLCFSASGGCYDLLSGCLCVLLPMFSWYQPN